MVPWARRTRATIRKASGDGSASGRYSSSSVMARASRPARSDDVDVDARAGSGGGGLDDGADRADHLALAADDLANVLLGDGHLVDGYAPGIDLLDLDGVR